MNSKRALTVRRMAYIALMTALLCICAWITVPFTVPFTMQTFGVFAALLLLGGRDGTLTIGLYLFAEHCVCYLVGTLWFVAVSGMKGKPYGFFPALALCVLPYVLPDLIKIALAELLSRRLAGRLKRADKEE